MSVAESGSFGCFLAPSLTGGEQRHFQAAVKVLEALQSQGYNTLFVGGCVRDALLGMAAKDYDLATQAPAPEVVALLSGQGFSVHATGLDHGTVTVVSAGYVMEVTTLREDLHCDGRHAEVRYGATFAQDAARRDFTVNALYADSQGRVWDFFGGVSDLQRRLLRFVGDPEERIKEDYLRILRFFRFAARLHFTMDAHALDVISQNLKGIDLLSRERVMAELSGIFASIAHPSPSPVAARNAGIPSQAATTVLHALLISGALGATHPALQKLCSRLRGHGSVPVQRVKEGIRVFVCACEALGALRDHHPGPDSGKSDGNVDLMTAVPVLSLLLSTLGEMDAAAVAQWLHEMKSSKRQQREAQLWSEVFLGSSWEHALLSEGRPDEAFVLLGALHKTLQKRFPLFSSTDDADAQDGDDRGGATEGEGGGANSNGRRSGCGGREQRRSPSSDWVQVLQRFEQDMGPVVSEEKAADEDDIAQRVYGGMVRCLRLFALEKSSHDLRIAPHLVDGKVLQAAFVIEPGPRLGEILNTIRCLQWQGLLTTTQQALDHIARHHQDLQRRRSSP